MQPLWKLIMSWNKCNQRWLLRHCPALKCWLWFDLHYWFSWGCTLQDLATKTAQPLLDQVPQHMLHVVRYKTGRTHPPLVHMPGCTNNLLCQLEAGFAEFFKFVFWKSTWKNLVLQQERCNWVPDSFSPPKERCFCSPGQVFLSMWEKILSYINYTFRVTFYFRKSRDFIEGKSHEVWLFWIVPSLHYGCVSGWNLQRLFFT